MKQKFINNMKSLFKSTYNNKELFERRKNSIIIPLIIFLLSIFIMVFPPYYKSMNQNEENVLKNFPGIVEPVKTLLTSSLDCHVENGKLNCSEDSKELNTVVKVSDEIKYTVIANVSTISLDTTVTYNSSKDTDNLVMLLNGYIRIRYVDRDHINGEIIKTEILGDYSELENYNFKEISETLANNPDLIDSMVSNFVYKTYTSTLDTKLLVTVSNSLFSFFLFVIVTSLILKGPYVFKRKKGFKFKECLKISLTSALPALAVSTLFYFVGGINFSLIFGIIYVIRIMFIYLKYILSGKNNIFVTLYNETHEERFKVQ